MFERVSAALRHIQEDLAQVLDAGQITAVCRDVGYRFRQRLLDPVTTIHLFVIQILHGNFAVARLREFTDKEFSEAGYCKAHGRLPLQVLQALLQRVSGALRSTIDDSTRWRGHRTFHLDGSSFSIPDTPELQKEFGQPGGQRPGCGFPVAHVLALFHAGTGFLLKILTAPLRTHDILGFDVAVHDAGGMSHRQRLGRLADHFRQRGQRGALADKSAQRLSLDQLHDQKRLTLVLVDIVDGADVWMVQGGDGPRFTLEALEGSGILGVGLG